MYDELMDSKLRAEIDAELAKLPPQEAQSQEAPVNSIPPMEPQSSASMLWRIFRLYMMLVIGFLLLMTAYILMSGSASNSGGGFALLAVIMALIGHVLILMLVVAYRKIADRKKNTTPSAAPSIKPLAAAGVFIFLMALAVTAIIIYEASNLQTTKTYYSGFLSLSVIPLINLGFIGAIASLVRFWKHDRKKSLFVVLLFLSPPALLIVSALIISLLRE